MTFKNIQIISLTKNKLDCSFLNYSNLEEVLSYIIPLGFSQSRVVMHNVSVILNKIFASERLNILEEKKNLLILNLLITLLNF